MAENSIVVVGFETRYEYNPKTRTNDRPIDYVMYAERFSANTQVVSERIDSINPAKLRHVGSDSQRDMKRAFFEHRWSQIEPAYKAWKEGNEIPEHGTSIAMLPSLGKPQIDALRSAGFKTIEDVAEAPDSAIQRIPLPNKATLKKEAVDFLEARKTGENAAKVADLEAKLEAAISMISELQAEKNEKPRRGRPPKAKAEETEANSEEAA